MPCTVVSCSTCTTYSAAPPPRADQDFHGVHLIFGATVPEGVEPHPTRSVGATSPETASAWVTRSSTGQASVPAPATGAQATASVVPSTSSHPRLDVVGHGRARRSGARRGSPRRARTARVPPRCTSCTSSSSPTAHGTPHSSRTSRARPARGDSPWSMPPPGSVHCPVWKPRGEIRVSSTCSSRRTSAYAATRCTRAGRWSASASTTSGTTGTAAVEDVRATGTHAASDGGAVDLDARAAPARPPAPTRRTRSAGRGRRRGARRARPPAGGRSRRGRSPRPRRPARSPRAPRARPRRAGSRRGRGRRRAGSRARSAEMLGDSRLSRMRSSRRITAYAATRCRFGRVPMP